MANKIFNMNVIKTEIRRKIDGIDTLNGYDRKNKRRLLVNFDKKGRMYYVCLWNAKGEIIEEKEW